MKCKLYIAKTYFLVNDLLTDERLTCIGEDFDDVEVFIQGVRMLPILPEHRDPDAPDVSRDGAVCVVESAEFYSEADRDSYMQHESHEPYVLQEYGRIDRYFSNVSKRESKNVKLPAILIDAIEDRNTSFMSEIRVANHTLRELLLYINGNDRYRLMLDPTSSTILKTCKVLDDFLDKTDKKFERGLYERSPLLFCDEHEYRSNLDIMLFHKRVDAMYRNRILDPDA